METREDLLAYADSHKCKPLTLPGQGINEDVMKNMFRLTPAGFKNREAVYRTAPLEIDGITACPPEEIVSALSAFFTAAEIPDSLHPISHAVKLLTSFLKISPFPEGNDDAALLLMNLLLIQGGYPTVTIGPDNAPSYFKLLSEALVSGDNSALDLFIIRSIVSSARKMEAANSSGCRC